MNNGQTVQDEIIKKDKKMGQTWFGNCRYKKDLDVLVDRKLNMSQEGNAAALLRSINMSLSTHPKK